MRRFSILSCLALFVFQFLTGLSEAQVGQGLISRPVPTTPPLTGPLGIGLGQDYSLKTLTTDLNLKSSLPDPGLGTTYLPTPGTQSPTTRQSITPSTVSEGQAQHELAAPIASGSPPADPPEISKDEDGGGDEEEDEEKNEIPWWGWGLGVLGGLWVLSCLVELRG